jgi:acetyl-CoA acetyltransferase
VKRAGYDGVVLACPVSVPYARYSAKPAPWWIGRALDGVLRAAGMEKRQLDGFACASFTLGADSAVAMTQHLGISPRWLDHVPMGGAAGVVSLRRAARAVQAGDADAVAVVAGDTNAPDSFRRLVSGFSRFSTDAVYPYGAGGPNLSFALITDAYMRAYGATREDFGRICIAQRANAMSFPHALQKKPMTMADYLESRPIADPVVLFDCVMPCAGAEAFLVLREADARAAGLRYVHLASAIERHNAYAEDDVQLRGGWAADADEMWAMAGMRAADIDIVETYDDYPVIVMLQFEGLGFCAPGEAAAFLRGKDLTCAGDLPHNTSGGQLSVGQAGAAGGHLGLVEAIRQLTGTALGAQVARARSAVVAGFGMINYDRGLCSAAAVLTA